MRSIASTFLVLSLVSAWTWAGDQASLPVPLSLTAMPDPNDAPFKFITIKPGSFMMGSPTTEEFRNYGEIQHKVTLTHAFELQVTTVTEAQWQLVVGDKRANLGKYPFTQRWLCQEHFDTKRGICPNIPLTNMSWQNAVYFANEMSRTQNLNPCYYFSSVGTPSVTGTGNIYDCDGYRLPTEAEWEYSARAGTTTAYFFGDSEFSLSTYAIFKMNNPGQDFVGQSASVASLEPNPWGLYDMYGNTYQWIHDCFDVYTDKSVVNPSGPKFCGEHVLRGGYWDSSYPDLRSAHRYPMEGSSEGFGFRLARTVK